MRRKGTWDDIKHAVLFIFGTAILVVLLMNFFLKIDIAAFLQKKFGTEPLPASGNALHVRIDTRNNDPNSQDVKVYEFHLTDILRQPECSIGECTGGGAKIGPIENNPSAAFDFYINEYKSGQCAIFAVNDYETRSDSGRIYYVSPGSKVQDEQNSIRSRINIISGEGQNECNLVSLQKDGYVCGGNNCKKLIKPSGFTGPGTYESPYSCAGQFNLVACGASSADNFVCEIPPSQGKGTTKNVIDEQFSNQPIKDDSWKCTSSCNLLVDKQYKVRYGLICGNDAKWHVCSDKNPDLLAGVNCKIGNTFTWEGNLIVGTLSLSNGPYNVNQDVLFQISYKGTGIKSISLNLDDIQPTPDCKFSAPVNTPDLPSSFSSDGRIWTYKSSDFGVCTGQSGCTITGISLICSKPGSYQFQAKINDNENRVATTNVLKVIVHEIGSQCGLGQDC